MISRGIVGALVGCVLLLGSAESAFAAIYHYAGITCATSAPTNSVACARTDATGFIVGLGRKLVLVQDLHGQDVFSHGDGGSRRSTRLPPANVWFTFRGIECTRRKPASIVCYRTDLIGYAVGISETKVAVIRLADMKPVFSRANTGVTQ